MNQMLEKCLRKTFKSYWACPKGHLCAPTDVQCQNASPRYGTAGDEEAVVVIFSGMPFFTAMYYARAVQSKIDPLDIYSMGKA